MGSWSPLPTSSEPAPTITNVRPVCLHASATFVDIGTVVEGNSVVEGFDVRTVVNGKSVVEGVGPLRKYNRYEFCECVVFFELVTYS